jgi:transcriptional regulator with XRE-family HTH domain
VPPRKLGMRIKELRTARGLSQEALAGKAGIARVYLAQIEGSAKNSPTRSPSLATLEKLAKALKVKVADLVK